MSKQSKRKPIPRNDSRIRDFLKDFAVPVITCACAAFVAYQANQISQLQAEIAKNAERPTIEVTERSFLDNYESEMEDSIEIAILDGKYDNYDSEIITFLTCNYDDLDENGRCLPFRTFEIPISSYYDTHFKSQSVYGKVEAIYTLQNTSWIRNLCSHAEDKYELAADRTFLTSVESFLKITYTNLLGEPETIYYRLDGSGIGPATRLNAEYGQARFMQWRNMTQEGLQLSPKDTASDLFRVLSIMDKAWDLYKE